jgi:hypothetical protein
LPVRAVSSFSRVGPTVSDEGTAMTASNRTVRRYKVSKTGTLVGAGARRT